MLQLKKIKKDYRTSSETVNALKGISLSFRKREFVSILGPSGCGKTTLLNIIGGLDQYTDGDLIINGTSTKEYRDRDWDSYRNHSIGFVFQSYNLIPHQTVLGNVELALTLSGVSKEERRKRAKAALESVGLGDQLNKRPAEMSGGQMQRVAIARALVNDPEIILADEPTGALDTKTSVQVMEILKEVSKERLVIMVTHNPELAEEYSSRIIRMVDGLIVDDTNPYDDESCEKDGKAAKAEIELKDGKKKVKKPTMSFFTAFMLSLRNLFTKKGRTLLTSFAGSIGIIGIALILAVSEGMTAYINHVQETTLSSYPLTLESTTVDMSALIESLMGGDDDGDTGHENDAVYKDPLIGELVEALGKIEANDNDLGAFKTFLESELRKEDSPIKDALSGIQYSYDLDLAIYTKNKDGKIIKSDTGELMADMFSDFLLQLAAKQEASGGDMNSGSMPFMPSMMSVQMWEELLPGKPDENGERPLVNELLFEQYELAYGAWPTAKNEIVLVLNEKNELDDLTLYAIGLISEEEIDAIIKAAAGNGTLPENSTNRWSYEEICNLRFKTIFPFELYKKNTNGLFTDMSDNELVFNSIYEEAMELKISGIIRPNPDAENAMIGGAIGYTYALTEHIIESAKNSEIVKAQIASPNYDVISGLPFKENIGNLSNEAKKDAFINYLGTLSDEKRADAFVTIKCLQAEKAGLEDATNQILSGFESKEQVVNMIIMMLKAEDPTIDESQITGYFENMTFDELKAVLRPSVEEMARERIHTTVKMQMAAVPQAMKLQMLDAEIGTYTLEDFGRYYDEITVFAKTSYKNNLISFGCLELDTPSSIHLFASSFENKDVITAEINRYNSSVNEEQRIAYTDIMGIMMSSITTIIKAITYVLIAFVAISLIVSSIMIGVITLISVQERTKEIGILRAIGASKSNVSSMFNAETMIIGLASGLVGVIITYLLCIPINLILNLLTGIPNLKAILPFGAAVILVAISVLLTLVSGIIPSRSAAKKDPVVALRTE